MKMKKLVCMHLVLIFTVIVISVPGAAAEPAEDASVVPVTHYEYPITVDSPDWFNYTVLEKVEMLRIPDEILERMTDEALVTAIAEYPYLCDLHVYGCGTMEDGISVSRHYFSALHELLTRDNAQEILKSYGVEAVRMFADSAREADSNEVFVANMLAELINTICNDDVISIDYSFSVQLKGGVYVGSATVYTPKGTPVTCAVYSDSDSKADHLAEDTKFVNTYGVTLVTAGSCVYNCHSYAWYSRSASNPYWMENPSAYMSDGSYRRIYSGSSGQLYMGTGIQSGDIVYYGGNTHSAVVTASLSVSTAAIGNAPCISKWGSAGVFRHNLGNVPAGYTQTSLTFWRLN